MLKKKILMGALALFALLFILEVFLRAQQKHMARPFVNLDGDKVRFDLLSDTLNHINTGEVFYRNPGDGIKKKLFYKNGVRINKFEHDDINDYDSFRVLFMGDSFMEGLDDPNTIPAYARKYLLQTLGKDNRFVFLNAGCSSYATSIYIPQAKMLIPVLKPDFVVVDIDETDLGDDYISYRDLTVRDEGGKIIAVKRTPVNYTYSLGLKKALSHSLYFMRLFYKLYHLKIHMPQVERDYRKADPRTPLCLAEDIQGSRDKYAAEIAFFERNLGELAETLIDLMHGKDRILFVFHPHLRHIQPDSRGLFYWNNFVSSSLNTVCEKYDIAFYDATEDSKRIIAAGPGKYYLPDEMHYSPLGLKILGEFIAARMLPLIEPLRRRK